MASYTIKSGDTLSKIARDNNTTVADLQKANPSITNPNLIYAGNTINIPDAVNPPAVNTNTNTNTAPTTSPPPTQSTPQAPKVDYSQYYYDPSSDAAYQQALSMLETVQQGTPTYAGTYDAKLDEIYNKIVNREDFSYDVNSDALYNQMKDQYVHLGNMAMMDTMGQAASLTGGYSSSYGQMVGQQAYQEHLRQLNDKVPELYGMALDQYNQEGQDLYNQFAMVGDLRDDEYGRYQDAMDRYWQDVDYHTSRVDNAYDQGYNNWYNSYQMGLDAENTAYERGQDAYERLATLITTTGYQPTEDELAAAGMSAGEVAAYSNYYNEQKTLAATKTVDTDDTKKDEFQKYNFARVDDDGNYVFYRDGKEYTFTKGVNPYTATTNPDVKNGTFKNGYQPNNVGVYKDKNGKDKVDKLSKTGITDVVNGVTQNVWMAESDGTLYIWDGTQNRYLVYDDSENE